MNKGQEENIKKAIKGALQTVLAEQMEAFRLDAVEYVLTYSVNPEVQAIADRCATEEDIEKLSDEELKTILEDFKDWDDSAEDGTRAFYTLGKIRMLENLIYGGFNA